ncbi:alpha/beta fold hydrolase [Pseudalkalibacillus decolorationis]|uniref:alpha/beta fold hydrolase n=1 Tax=Pseudalkalibacillus decolorationis TaxID=163879 RepID=UPI00214746C2|nr:alpha/beta hydrolase [Pseudalkalibacillus decolorationis]
MSINHKIIGEGHPVVILHGWSLDHQVMVNCLEPVFTNYNDLKRIYIDLPGMGQSKSPETIQNSDDMLKAFLKFIDGLIPNEPFLVCGYSYGGYIARGITRFRRDLVKGILLIAPGVNMDFDKRCLPEKKVLIEDPNLLSRLSPEEAEEFESMAVVQGEQQWQRFREEILIPSNNANPGFMEQIRENGYNFTFDVDADIPPFEHPTLIITGRQDHAVGYKDAWSLIDQYPRATYAVLDMGGHNLQIEQPDLFESLIANWLDRLRY